MRLLFTICTLALFNAALGQKQFDSSHVERILTSLPGKATQAHTNENVLRVLGAVDRKYRSIADTLFPYKSRKYTVLQTVLIEADDSTTVNPLSFGDQLQTAHIIFHNQYLNDKVDSIAKSLNNADRDRFYEYLINNFDHFSWEEKKLYPQPVRIRYIRFPNDLLATVGIDIYGTHFLWTINRSASWDVIKVESLWVY